MKKKRIVTLAVLVIIIMFTTGCSKGNRKFLDTTSSFDYAVIELPNGKIVEGKVKTWRNYDRLDQLQVTMEDGKIYLVHSSDCALINTGAEK